MNNQNNMNEKIYLKTEKKENILNKKLNYDLGWFAIVGGLSFFTYPQLLITYNLFPKDLFNTGSWLFGGLFMLISFFLFFSFVMGHAIYAIEKQTIKSTLIFLLIHLTPVIYCLYILTT